MFTLPDLPYSYDALEPFIDTETMHLHHDKHHAGYVDNLNKLVDPASAEASLEDLLKSDNPKIRNNAGGHFNHSFFWKIMCPSDQSGKPLENILALKEEFDQAALSHFGSGWAWITLEAGSLKVEVSANQENPITQGRKPVLGIDVWEHAYYLKYKNVRVDYIKAFWNIVNWEQVNTNFR
ncbi:MAG TPA: superoxide dismutase [Alphaproteobacteria bacterium]|jgi:Fe-Mn family superoxide dismutase|nr:superoxide dismutase [Alphaproteobacteria bacterium]